MGIAAILLVLEAGRRVAGNVLPILAILFLTYCRFGNYVPGKLQIRGYSLSRIVQHMYLTPEGIFRVALGVSPLEGLALLHSQMRLRPGARSALSNGREKLGAGYDARSLATRSSAAAASVASG